MEPINLAGLGLFHLQAAFEENGITTKIQLKDLVVDYIEFRNLVPKASERLILKSFAAETWEEAPAISTPITSQASGSELSYNITNTTDDDDLNVSCASSSSNIPVIWIEEFKNVTTESAFQHSANNTLLTSPVKNQLHSPVSKRRRLAGFNLKNLLSETKTGQAILAVYEVKHELSSTCQSYLVDIIAQHFVNTVPFTRLSNIDFSEISDCIVQTFPGEVKEVYYCSPIKKRHSRENKSGLARGKLVDKYRNSLTFLRSADVIPSIRLSSPVCNVASDKHVIDDGSITNAVLWLQNNSEPWELVLEKWRLLNNYRQHFLLQDNNTLEDIIQKFPILEHTLGYSLIEEDFKEKFPNQQTAIFRNFETVFINLLAIRRHSLSNTDLILVDILENDNAINNESKHYLMVTLMSALLPPNASLRKGKCLWKPTISDSRDGIILHIKASGDLETKLEEKRNKLKKLSLPMLPFVIIEGPTYMSIKNVYVAFCDTTYKPRSLLKALDICFQLMIMLNLKYPYECSHIWLFIQLTIYKLKTKYDNIPNIIDLSNKISK